MTYRLGVDVGGTFTDLCLYDISTGRLEFAKTASTSDQSEGVVRGIRELIERLDIPPSAIDFFIHGTTVATNTLLQRSGARTALVATAGFRDVLQIGRQERPHLYDWRIQRPEPLVPRHLRFEIRERVLHTGEVLAAIEYGELDALVERVRAADVEAVAVCLLHSYANPVHEKAVGEALTTALPDTAVALSHQVLPEFKEYERMSTTAINAYVAPVMRRYLGRLEREIAALDISSDVHIMQSNGGTTTGRSATDSPVRTILSGPAAGVIGGVILANRAGQRNTISVDMGGTSFDVCLSYQGEVRRTSEAEIERLPIKVPTVDIHTLGAGGGSIAWIDPGGGLRVGPQSAGAHPGPASYGEGGESPTVTDANLVLGRLNSERFLGGRMSLHPDLARQAIADHVATPLGLGVEEAAEGVVRVVNAAMIKGIRVVSVARGYDPRDFCLMAFGGAGPLHAAELAEELGIPTVLVPIAPGLTSSLGLLLAERRHDYVRTLLRRGDEIAPAEIGSVFATMETEALGQMRREGVESRDVTLVRTADMRYRGQGFELDVVVASGELSDNDLSAAYERFHEAHTRAYGYANKDPIELVNLRVTATSGSARPELPSKPLDGSPNPPDALDGRRPVFFRDRFVSTPIYDRRRLDPGDSIDGPAVVEQLDSTTLVWPKGTVRVDKLGNLLLEAAKR
jgi:N-methylhydantoinase A